MGHGHRLRRLSALFLAGWLIWGYGCWLGLPTAPLPGDAPFTLDADQFTLLVRLAHVSDTHIVDEESPGRLAEFDGLVSSAWRPQEAYAAQVLDGIIRAVNRYHQDIAPVDLLLHTGDAVDNAQKNELRWVIQVMEGQWVDPRSGPDDRDPGAVPDPLLDPHQPFQAEGLYTQGRHGSGPTIAWYAAVGNHDVYASGNFPIIEIRPGQLASPLPLWVRPGLLLPVLLIPDGEWTNAFVSPANPGPPPLLHMPVRVQPNPDRAFCTRRDILEAHFASSVGPPGHGFDSPGGGRTWYSRAVAAGVRLIVLDTTDVCLPIPTLPYPEGAIGEAQLGWFRAELSAAAARGEWVIVASHHPSESLHELWGSAISGEAFRAVLNEHENVVLHLAGHTHINRVFDRGGYVEIVTGSTLDYPQTGRIIELRLRNGTGELMVNYLTVSHRDVMDSLSGLREVAYALAVADAGVAAQKVAEKTRQTCPTRDGARQWLDGAPADRTGCVVLKKGRQAYGRDRGSGGDSISARWPLGGAD